jgi:phosphoglycolate phosphatase
MVTEHLKTKEALIIENVGNLSGSDWVVGDTGHDINVGKLLGLKTCAVTDGFMSKKLLERYSPDFVIANVANFAVLLEDR